MPTCLDRIQGCGTTVVDFGKYCGEQVKHAAEQVQTFVYWLERKVCQLIDYALPETHAFLVRKIITSIPEILFTAAALTGYMTIPAMLFWSTRLLSASWPVIKCVVKGQVTAEHLGPAASAMFENFKQNYKKLWPAIAVAFATTSVVYGALGWMTNDMTLFARSVLFFGVSSVASWALIQDAKNQSQEQAPQQQPLPIQVQLNQVQNQPVVVPQQVQKQPVQEPRVNTPVVIVQVQPLLNSNNV